MKTLTKLLGAGALILATATGLVGCGSENLSDEPYKPTKMVELEKNKDEKIVVEGIPSLVRGEGFVLRDGKSEVYIEREIWRNNANTGDYSAAREALIRDAKESKTVKVYGFAEKDKTVEARFVEADGTLYPIYK